MGLAAVAALVIGMATPSLTAAGTSPDAAIQQSASTDIGAARRNQRARSVSSRHAYSGVLSGAGVSAPSSPGYGYGVGDNSRNQTW